TSKLYTDLSIITANKQIGMEAAYVFTRLCMGEFVDETNYLLVAPKCMKSKILNYMDKEIEIARAGGKAYVGAKINSLTDKEIIDKLIECSRAGVRVEMIVRGICCLIPGVKGHTENISVISIVGRYLEHSRVYIFGTPDRDNIYISSADFMTRNMERRVEIAAPIYDDSIKTRIRNMFHIMECDTVKARQLCSDGNYVHRTIADIKDFTDEEWEQASEGLRINSQEYFAAR
ncbi:MAG: polyphosphate kinase 1, partial [Lachnospira sp.]|nr:polyphosphate kinase 1 [Lachnospira sp.]